MYFLFWYMVLCCLVGSCGRCLLHFSLQDWAEKELAVQEDRKWGWEHAIVRWFPLQGRGWRFDGVTCEKKNLLSWRAWFRGCNTMLIRQSPTSQRENIPSIFRGKELVKQETYPSLQPASCTLWPWRWRRKCHDVSKLCSITTQMVVVFILITLNHFFSPISPWNVWQKTCKEHSLLLVNLMPCFPFPIPYIYILTLLYHVA